MEPLDWLAWFEAMSQRIADDIAREFFGSEDAYPNIILGED